jgi:GTPase SAR1 family protein
MTDCNSKPFYKMKIAVVGDENVGKSFLINTFVDSSGDKQVIHKDGNLIIIFNRKTKEI